MFNANKLLKLGSAQIGFEADILLSYLIHRDKTFLYTHPEYKLTSWQVWKFHRLIKKRLHGWPIAYLIKQKGFYGLTFKVNQHTLIPRPESELFIEELKKINPQNKTIVDIGTGSGCLIITTAKLFPNNKFIAVDISKPALKIARHNAKQHSVDINFIPSNLLNFLEIKNYKLEIVLANLPYLRPEEMKESSIQKEPKLALLGGSDGLEYYQRLFKQIKNLGQQPNYILCEINPQQKNKLFEFASIYLPNYNLETRKDLSGQIRLIILQTSSQS